MTSLIVRRPTEFTLNDAKVSPIVSPCLPESDGRRSLVFDLDDTLIHTYPNPVIQRVGLYPVEFGTKTYYFEIRNGVVDFLKRMKKEYELILFTSADQRYADQILQVLESDEPLFEQKLYQTDCVTQTGFVKDLQKVGRDKFTTICFDDYPYGWASQDNICVCKKYNGGQDAEVKRWENIVTQCSSLFDVREALLEYSMCLLL
ncbi:carboxy-terminal domain RNA polymerase II polypeptide A small phosphatase, putative [Entamoeba invadens IP1]|uniref:Mitochondrial import inner membrane translocase subunit TIM50 n=1 Tax=Entamoeba invadens IP1 TaxID=370355 RepID=A0A0A1U8A5_ENTIV|nr:carboxy-terminal domain RNA polymerase II polypeptide A small phosphatase, putative [Entamoeba invadens IP1]ELP89270.1 carboxy-terminal domain RNA polymerase II polypeptide A small phosphatase, putative [Entamoeba invadens IP1]|eukprot:XP_004256041.1 carboxy-terminal domain RNA polymerase II polypeptide A small phosphatase, putative [Entamoeba invadens IP1]